MSKTPPMTGNAQNGLGHDIEVESFPGHQIIRQPNRLKAAIRPAGAPEDDPVARAEKALAELSVEFEDWMQIECDRLAAAHSDIVACGITADTAEELLTAVLHIKGVAATFGYPIAAAAAESLYRIIAYVPDFAAAPTELIGHHVQSILAIVREQKREGDAAIARELSRKLRSVSDEYLFAVNRDRPELLEILGAPSIAPND